mgnify:FL=1
MKNTRLSKFVLVADIIICTLFFFLLLHKELMNYEMNMLLVSVPLLRIWLSFLTYSKSKLGAVPLVILSLISLIACIDMRNLGFAFTLFVQPLYMLISKFSHLIGGQDIIQLRELMINLQYYTSEITILCTIWLIGIPLAVYLYRLFKKQLHTSGLSIWKSIALGAYIFVSISILTLMMELPFVAIKLLFALIFLALIPIIFYRGKFRGLFARHEIAFLIAFAMLLICYAFAVKMGEVTVITACVFPMAFYALANWYVRRKITLNETIFVVSASVVFSFAQYIPGIIRLICLFVSLILFAVPLIRFAKTSNRKSASVCLYVMIAIIVPVLSIGYNPYSVLNAGRLTRFDDYSYSENGILFVRGKDGYGLRDRYKMILPAEYDYIEILTPSKPYCKVRKDGKYRIYDIERHELLSEEWFEQITPCEEYVYRLKTANGDKYLFMPEIYDRNEKKQEAKISLYSL